MDRADLVLDTILISLFSLFTILVTFYLPLQVETIIIRARPYFLGDQPTQAMPPFESMRL